MEIIDKIKNFSFSNKTVRKTIFRAEVVSQNSGVSVMEILDYYAKELAKNEKTTSRIITGLARQLRAGKKRWTVYSPFISKDILSLLKIAEEKNIPSGTIFTEYLPIKEMADNYISSIRKGLLSPLFIFLLVVFGLGSTISKFGNIRQMGIIKFSDVANFCIDNFYIVNFSVFGIMVVLFVMVPDKLPILKNVFTKLNSMLALSTINTMFSLSYSSADVIGPIAKQFNLKAKVVRAVKKDISGLVQMLSSVKFLTPFEAADIKIAMTHGDVEKPIQNILATRKREVKNLTETVGVIIKNITLLLLATPLLMAIVVFMNMMMSVSSGIVK